MATGIQTGIRARGSRVSAPAPATRLSAMGAVLGRWNALSRRVKGAIILSLLALQGLLLGLGVHSRQTGYVDLYPTKLQAEELPEISRALLDMGIEHEATPKEDGILVPRDQRNRARAILASRNLPLNRVLTAEEVTENVARTSSDRKALQQRLLEGEIILSLRDMAGVQDARVKLALPEQRIFSDSDTARASVVITTRTGHEFTREAISGMLHLVAFSVPGLLPENVQLNDQNGQDLSSQIPRDSGGGLQVSGAHFEVAAAQEQRVQEKIQRALDHMFPGRTRVLVNLDLDFSEAEERLYTPGTEQDAGMVKSASQITDESLKGHGKDNKDFRNRKESTNYKFSENYKATLQKYSRVRGVSATVFADGISPEQARSLEQSVAGALGLKKNRGDFVFVDTTPWDHVIQEPAPLPAESLLALDQAEQAPSSSHYGLLALLLAQSTLMAGGFVYLTTRQRVASGVEMVTPSGLDRSGIVDHARAKTGETLTDMNRTGVRTTELLEGIVRERPNQVADMLRNTWLS